MRETETQLKLTQNDYELLQNQNTSQEIKIKDFQEKLETADAKLQQFKDRAFQAEKEKEQASIESQNQIELLQYKLLHKVENESANGDDQSGSAKQFTELLGICKSDLDEILNRLKSNFQNEATEDQMRKELLEQSKKMAELKAQQEKQIYELTNENFQKVDLLQQKWENEKKSALLKLKDEIQLKNERIKDLEKNEKRSMTDKEKADSFARQVKEI